MASKRLAKPDAVVLSTPISGKAVAPDGVDVVIYHDNCTDGYAAAFAAWLRLGDKAQYIGLQHGPGLVAPDLTGKRVVVLDFSFNEAVTQELMKQTGGAYLVLDHHISAKAALAGLPDANKTFEMGQSGATLAWDFFHRTPAAEAAAAAAGGAAAPAAGETPLLFRYIEDRDIWRWAYADSEAFSAGFGLVEKSFEGWKALLEGGEPALAAVIDRGKAILEYQNKVRDGHVKRARAARLKAAPQYVGLAVNGSTLASDIGNAMCQVRLPQPGGAGGEGAAAADGAAAVPLPAKVQFGLIWEYDMAARAFRVSLRSDSDDVDVSVIAKSLGGGGHRRASGFTHTGPSIEDILLPVEGLPAEWKPEPAGKEAEAAARLRGVQPGEGRMLAFPLPTARPGSALATFREPPTAAPSGSDSEAVALHAMRYGSHVVRLGEYVLTVGDMYTPATLLLRITE